MQLPLPDKYLIFVRVCECGRPVLRHCVGERDGEKFFICVCRNKEVPLEEHSTLERLNVV